MQIYTALQIGDYHTNHCEDYLFTNQIDKNTLLCAVMDGCTMATDSYFAATLTGKLLRKISTEENYRLFRENINADRPEILLKKILQRLFDELNTMKNQLLLNKDELLTTLILLILDTKERNAVAIVIGDGLLSVNGQITEFDQDNKPDYLGYHLHKDFEQWYSRQQQVVHISHWEDIAIATDGIFTFSPFTNQSYPEADPLQFLLADTSHQENSDMLDLKLKGLLHQHGLKNTDDLALIRVINIEQSH